MIKELIGKVVKGENLTEARMEETMHLILDGQVTPAQIGALVTGLRMKGETVDEIAGAARAVRARGEKISLNNHLVNIDRDEINIENETILDTSGTGGDGTRTFNISTATALVAAGGGVRVAKHGHRAVSSRCGSADVLENLGVKLDINASDVEMCIREIGIGFLYAPLYQGPMKQVAVLRQEMGIRTIFHLVGPLANPAGASAQVLGVYEPGLTEKMAHVLSRLGTRKAFVVHGERTFDEISICGPTRISRLEGQEVTTYKVTPEEFGLTRASPAAIEGGDARKNAKIVQEVLNGVKDPRRDVVLLNAAAAFVVTGMDQNMEAGILRARESIDSGSALEKLKSLIRFTQSCGEFVRKDL